MEDQRPAQESGTRVDRRQFVQAAGIAATAVAFGNSNATTSGSQNPAERASAAAGGRPGEMPLRPFGSTGEKVSALGMGGHHLGDVKTVDDAIRLVHEAVEGGITFFDNCWEYWNGRAEDWLGRGLKGRRDKVFLMTKVCTHGRGADLAMKMLEESLRRLQTDHLDLWQVHGVCFDNDPELAYAKGGVLEALDQAKKQGKMRFVGFTGHKNPDIHLDMIRRGYPFDTVQMPLNCLDASFPQFRDNRSSRAEPARHRRAGNETDGGNGCGRQSGS